MRSLSPCAVTGLPEGSAEGDISTKKKMSKAAGSIEQAVENPFRTMVSLLPRAMGNDAKFDELKDLCKKYPKLLNAYDDRDRTLLALAVNRKYDEHKINGIVKVVNLLIECGANPSLVADEGWTPLHYSAFHQQAEAVTALINAGADTEVKNEKEETPIILFLQNLETLNSLGAIATAQALIAGGINLRTTDEDDNSVLAVAGKRSASLILFEKLVDAIKDQGLLAEMLQTRNKQGETPLLALMYHRKVGHSSARNRRSSSSGDEAFDPISIYLQYGANLYDVNKEGENVLHIAVKRHDVDLVKALLKKDPELKLLTMGPSTPYRAATELNDASKQSARASILAAFEQAARLKGVNLKAAAASPVVKMEVQSKRKAEEEEEDQKVPLNKIKKEKKTTTSNAAAAAAAAAPSKKAKATTTTAAAGGGKKGKKEKTKEKKQTSSKAVTATAAAIDSSVPGEQVLTLDQLIALCRNKRGEFMKWSRKLTEKLEEWKEETNPSVKAAMWKRGQEIRKWLEHYQKALGTLMESHRTEFETTLETMTAAIMLWGEEEASA